MAVVTSIIIFLLLVLFLVYRLSKRKFDYWKKRNVPHLKPTPVFGNYGDYIRLKAYVGHVSDEICKKFPGAPYVGTYYGTEPALLLLNPDLIKLVTTKDFYYFSSREISDYTHKEVFTQNMFFTYGNRWKVIRQNFTALFSSAKMKNMFPLIEECSHVFENLLDKEAQSNSVEVRSLMAKFTMDCIGSCVFGINTYTMTKTENNPFRKMGDLIFELSNIRGWSLLFRAMWPSIFYGFGLKVFPKEMDTFFQTLITDVFKSRHYEPTGRNDFIDLVLMLKKNTYLTGDSITNMITGDNKKIKLEADDEILVAQCQAFFAAGFETSASTLSFTLFVLAKNQEAQNRAIEEVDAYLLRHNNKLGYDCVSELPYLEACVDEALRLYPLFGILAREVVEDYTLPTGLCLEKGTRVHLPLYHLHRNPDHFPEPEKYQPERFLPENKKNIRPYTYMPFGEGPRICIGMRFARMQMMAGLVTLLKKYRLELGDGMPSEIEFDPRGLATCPKHGIYLRLVPREGWQNRIFAK